MLAQFYLHSQLVEENVKDINGMLVSGLTTNELVGTVCWKIVPSLCTVRMLKISKRRNQRNYTASGQVKGIFMFEFLQWGECW